MIATKVGDLYANLRIIIISQCQPATMFNNSNTGAGNMFGQSTHRPNPDTQNPQAGNSIFGNNSASNNTHLTQIPRATPYSATATTPTNPKYSATMPPRLLSATIPLAACSRIVTQGRPMRNRALATPYSATTPSKVTSWGCRYGWGRE